MTTTADDWGPLSILPGNSLMWVLIRSEMLVFSAFCVIFNWQRAFESELFDLSQLLLDPICSGLNTLVLLTSGLFTAVAVQASAAKQVPRCRLWLALTMVLGLGLQAGHVPEPVESNVSSGMAWLLVGCQG